MSKRRTETDQVHSITSTQAPLGQDIDRRARRYLAQMVLRTLCFLGAVLSWGRVPTWISVTLLVGAVVLPYIAVVLANAGRERPNHADSLLGADPLVERREIGRAPAGPGRPAPSTPSHPAPTRPSPTASGATGAGAQRRPVPPGPPAWDADRAAAPSRQDRPGAA